MDIQAILDEIDELSNLPDSITVTSVDEPTQVEWESAWVAAGHALPIRVGTEMLWNDGTHQRAVYMAVGDRFTIVTNYADRGMGASDPRDITCLGWLDDDHLFGIGTWGLESGTFRLYMDGSVEHICDEYAVANHAAAELLLVQDSATKELKTYNFVTGTLSAAIVTIVNWSQDTDYVNTRAAWTDDTNAADLSFYFVDGTTLYNYDGVSVVDTVATIAAAGELVYQNGLVVFSASSSLYYVDTADTWPTTPTTLLSAESYTLVRRTPGSNTLVDVAHNTTKWSSYRQFNTEDLTIPALVIKDTYTSVIDELGADHQIVHEKNFADANVDKFRWAAPLINTLDKTYNRIMPSPDGSKFYVWWYQTDASWWASAERTYADDGQYYFKWSRSARIHDGAVVVADNDDDTTGRVYRITEWSSEKPDTLYLNVAEKIGTTILRIKDIDTIPAGYDILKMDIRVNASANIQGNLKLYEADGTEILTYGMRWYGYGSGFGGISTVSAGWASGIPLFVSTGYSMFSLTLMNFRDMSNTYRTMLWFDGMYYVAAPYVQKGVGFAQSTEAAKVLSYLQLDIAASTISDFHTTVYALKTEAGYSKDRSIDDYRMA